MKVYIIDRSPSGLRLEVAELKKRLKKAKITFSDLNADGPLTVQKLEIYDIVQFPAILVTHDDGVLERLWQGALPIYDDIIAAALM